MEIFAIFFVIYSTLDSSEGVKNYRFVSLDSCKTDNELIVAFKKCEVDGIYFTFITEVKSPITKLILSTQMSIIQNNKKTVLKESIASFNWCALFGKNGKIPRSPGWKAVMKGFGKYLKEYLTCPIIKNIELNRVYGDPKMLLWVPNMKAQFQLAMNAYSVNGLKELGNISFTVEVYE